MKEVIAGLVVLQVKNHTGLYTEDELHAAIVEALALAEMKEIPYANSVRVAGSDAAPIAQVS